MRRDGWTNNEGADERPLKVGMEIKTIDGAVPVVKVGIGSAVILVDGRPQSISLYSGPYRWPGQTQFKQEEVEMKTGKRQKVFGAHSINGVLLLMGTKGFSVADAKAFLKSEKLSVAQTTIETRIGTGRRMAAGETAANRGELAVMGRKDWSKILPFRGSAPVKMRKARAVVKAKPAVKAKAKPAVKAKPVVKVKPVAKPRVRKPKAEKVAVEAVEAVADGSNGAEVVEAQVETPEVISTDAVQ